MKMNGSGSNGALKAGETFCAQPAAVADADPRLADQLNKLAARYRDDGCLDEAEALYLRALSLRNPAPGKPREELSALKSLGELFTGRARPDRAEALLRKVADYIETTGDHSAHSELPGVLRHLALALAAQSKHSECGQVLERALACADSLSEPAIEETVQLLKDLADHFLRHAKTGAASSDLKAQALPLAYGLYELGSFYLKESCYEESQYYLRLAVRQAKEDSVQPSVFRLPEFTRGRISPDASNKLKAISSSYRTLSRAESASGQFRQALGAAEKALVLALAALPEPHPQIAVLAEELCELQLLLGNSCGAESSARQAFELRRRLIGSDHPRMAGSLSLLARACLAKGDRARGEELLRGAYDLLCRAGGEGSAATALVLSDLAEIFLSRGELEQAKSLSLRAISISEAAGCLTEREAERARRPVRQTAQAESCEQAVLSLVASGLSNFEISSALETSNVAVRQALSKVQAELASMPAKVACARLADKLAV